MTWFWLFLVSCGQPEAPRVPTWTELEAIRPTWELLDSNRDGSVGEQEWGPVSYGGPMFAELDQDQSGGVDLSELLRLVRTLDPDGFDGKRMKSTPSDKNSVAPPSPVSREVRLVGNVLLFLTEEVRGVKGVELLPTGEELRAASQTENLASPESRTVLAQLRESWQAVGRTFPQDLSALIDGAETQ